MTSVSPQAAGNNSDASSSIDLLGVCLRVTCGVWMVMTLLLPQRSDDDESPKSFLLLMLLSFGLACYAMWPFRTVFFLAIVLAIAVQPLFKKMAQWFGGRRTLAASILCFMLFALIIAPFGAIVAFAVQEVTVGLEWVRDELGLSSVTDLSVADLPQQAQHYLDSTLQFFHLRRSDLRERVGQALSGMQAFAPAVVGFSFGAIADAMLLLVGFFFLTLDGATVANFIARVSPLNRRQTVELMTEFRNVSSAALISTIATAGMQAGILGVGFAVAGIPHWAFFAILTLLAAFVPVVGAMLIWAPAAAILAFTSHIGYAIGLALWSGGAIFAIEHVVKPLLMRGKAEIHAGIMFFALLGGLTMFGIVGVLAGPLIIALFLAMIRIYERDFKMLATSGARTPDPKPLVS